MLAPFNRIFRFTTQFLLATLMAASLFQLPNQTRHLVQASGGVLYVAPGGDCGSAAPCYATLQAGIDAAAGGDTVKVAEGTYTGTTPTPDETCFAVAFIAKALTLAGGYTRTNWETSDPQNHPAVVDAENVLGRRGVTIDGTLVVGLISLTGLTIQHGHLVGEDAGAGIKVMAVPGSGTVEIRNNLIQANHFDIDQQGSILGYGGGIYILDGEVTIAQNTIENNSAGRGGGVDIEDGIVTLTGNTIHANTSSLGGGGGINVMFDTVFIDHNTISENVSALGGGLSVQNGIATVTANLIEGNSTILGGGGVYFKQGNLFLTGNIIHDNHQNGFGGGGGIQLANGYQAVLEDNFISENTAVSDGGGIYMRCNTYLCNQIFPYTLTNNILRDNHADGSGGAIYNNTSLLTMDGNILSGNSAGVAGGAMVLDRGTTQAQNDMIVANTAPSAAVLVRNGGSLTALEWTVANNGAEGILTTGPAVTLGNSIVAGHTSYGLQGASLTANRTLFYANGTDCSGGSICAASLTGDPKFAYPLAGNYHITPGSAALDTGFSVAVDHDFEGDPRPFGPGFDIGADEMGNTPRASFTFTQTDWIGPATQFTNTSVAIGETTYQWDFGDETHSTDVNPVHTYTSPGDYTVTLVATNQSGTDTATQVVSIPYLADFSSTSPDWLGQQTYFTNLTTPGSGITFTWDFGDGQASSDPDPLHTYAAPGVYSVILTASDASGSGVMTRTVTVYGAPEASFTSSTPDWLGQAMAFNGSITVQPAGDPTLNLTWDFGDSTTSQGPAVTAHTYAAPGVYQVTLSAQNAAGTSHVQHAVEILAPEVAFSAAAYTILESAGQAVIPVTLSQASEAPVSVAYTASAGTATAGTDFIPASGTLTFDPGQTTQSFSVEIVNDSQGEGGETVWLALSVPSHALLGATPTAVLTIQDDDPPQITGFEPPSATSGGPEFTLTITGTNFVDGVSVAQWNGTDLPTTVISSTRLSVPVSPQMSYVPAFIDLTVTNPPPGAGLSNHQSFSINPPPAEVCPGATDVTLPSPAGPVRVSLYGLSGCVTLTLAATRGQPADSPTGFILLPAYFDLSVEPVGEATFSKAAIRLPYTPADLAAAGIPEASLRLLQYRENHWVDITAQLDTAGHTISGETDRLTRFAIGYFPISACAIAINNKASYTASLQAQVFSNTPDAAEIMLSEDPAFTGATPQPYQVLLPWTFSNPGLQIVPLTLYARLLDSGGQALCGDSPISASIGYDPLPPAVTFTLANIQPGPPAEVTIHLNASDQVGGSGVAAMQASTDSSFSGAAWQPYSITLVITASPGDTIYVRVLDGAGNISPAVSAKVFFSVYLPNLQKTTPAP